MFRHSLHPTRFGFTLGLAVIALWALLWIWVVGQLAGVPRQPERRLPPVAEPAPSKPITVTSDIQSAKLLRKVIPVYPQFAIIARVSGTVHLMGTIGKDGMIERLLETPESSRRTARIDQRIGDRLGKCIFAHVMRTGKCGE